MKRVVHAVVLGLLGLACSWGAPVQTVDGVKVYLVAAVRKVVQAATSFQKNSLAYQEILTACQGDYAKAAKTKGPELARLLAAMQEDYKAMDSFGYETVEGIVAGVEPLAHFDVYLDAGVPKNQADAETPAAPVSLKLPNGTIIDQEGALFTFLIEPMLWGGDSRWIVPVKAGALTYLPKAELLVAVANDTLAKVRELLGASEAWVPTKEQCLTAIITMTPTLSGYFDDWKESRYAPEKSGRFQAVSRVSDMKGIMGSVALMFEAVRGEVQSRDKALAQSIGTGFAEMLAFLDKVEAREKKAAGKLNPAEIDELAAQARTRAEKIVPQVQQAASILQLKSASAS